VKSGRRKFIKVAKNVDISMFSPFFFFREEKWARFIFEMIFYIFVENFIC